MRKLLSVALLFVAILSLSACKDTQTPDDSIKVQFYSAVTNDTNPTDMENLTAGQKIAKPADPFREGFAFDGWFTEYNTVNEWDFDTDTVGETSMILFAKWVPAIYDLTLVLYLEDGAEVILTNDDIPAEFTPDDNIVLPIPSRTGFTFVSWYRVDELILDTETGLYEPKAGDPGYTIVPTDGYEDLTLYAYWETIRVRVQFDANYPIDDEGPDNPTTMYLDYGTEIDFTMFADTDAYTFLGWNTRADGTGTFYVNGAPFERTAKVKLFGIWEAK